MKLFSGFSLLLSLALAGCGGDGGEKPGAALRSLETEDAAGNITSVTLLDRNGDGKLTRVRHYISPGSDGLWRTADDELASYSACTQSRSGDLLLDPLLELEGAAWLSERFEVRNCALDEQASAISNQTFSNAGIDGLWFTADDGAAPPLTLRRTATGHRRTVDVPPLQPCDINCEGLDNVVYNPYAGMTVETLATYETSTQPDSRRLQFPATAFRYDFDSSHTLQRKTLETPQALSASGESNIVLDLFMLGLHSVYEKYEAQSDGSRLASYTMVVNADVFDGIAASATGQILLAVLGFNGESVEIDGQPFRELTAGRFRMIEQNGRLQELIQLAQAGDDGIWGSADDAVARRQRYFYAD